MLASVIAAFLYLRIMVSTWMVDAGRRRRLEPVPVPFATGLAIAAAVGFTLLVGIFPEWLLDAAEATTSSPADPRSGGFVTRRSGRRRPGYRRSVAQ